MVYGAACWVMLQLPRLHHQGHCPAGDCGESQAEAQTVSEDLSGSLNEQLL